MELEVSAVESELADMMVHSEESGQHSHPVRTLLDSELPGQDMALESALDTALVTGNKRDDKTNLSDHVFVSHLIVSCVTPNKQMVNGRRLRLQLRVKRSFFFLLLLSVSRYSSPIYGALGIPIGQSSASSAGYAYGYSTPFSQVYSYSNILG